MIKDLIKILFLFLHIFTWGCSFNSPNEKRIQEELDLKTSSTTTIDISSCKLEKYALSKLIDTLRYVPLENSDEALIGVIRTIKVTKDLIYVLDFQNDQLKCFDKTGKFIRNACMRGGGPEEIGHLIDFDVDEEFLYVLDGAKITIHVFDHAGLYIQGNKMPFRAQKIKCLPDKNFLFELAPFANDNSENPNLVLFTNQQFEPINSFLRYIDGVFVGISFANQANSSYLYPTCGNGIYEMRDSLFFMKYYIDFGGKYFNADKNVNGFEKAVEQGIYFTLSAPLHNERYLLQTYTAGMKRDGTLLIRIEDDKPLFIQSLIQDKSDLIDFSFSYTMGYDVLSDEFFGICNHLDLSNFCSDDKDNIVKKIKECMPEEVQSILLQDDPEKDLNNILLFYKLKNDIDF